MPNTKKKKANNTKQSSRDLDLDPMTFIYDLDRHPLKMSYLQTKNYELSTSRRLKLIVLQAFIHTQTSTMPPKTLPRHFAGGNKKPRYREEHSAFVLRIGHESYQIRRNNAK